MRGLKSYRLKTVVMLMVRKDPDRLWRLDYTTFLEVLEALRCHLNCGTIPSYFDASHNLIHGMDTWRKIDIAGFINNAVEDLRASVGTRLCYDTWTKYFEKERSTRITMPSEDVLYERRVATRPATDDCMCATCFIIVTLLFFVIVLLGAFGSKWIKIR